MTCRTVDCRREARPESPYCNAHFLEAIAAAYSTVRIHETPREAAAEGSRQPLRAPRFVEDRGAR